MKRTEKPQSQLADLTTISGWSKLQAQEQSEITTETMAIATALQNVSQAKIAVGEHLSRVRTILEPKRIFTKYLKTMFHLSKATAYRYIELYEAAKSVLPAPVLQVAMMRPDDRFTVKAFKAAPRPPRTTNVIKINEYLDSIQRKHGTTHVERKAPEDVKKAMFHSLRLLLSKVPTKQRTMLLIDVIGMVLTDAEITSEIRIAPKAIPDSFLVTRGRPRRAVA